LTSSGTIVQMNPQENGMSRRDFLKQSLPSAFALGALAIPGLPHTIQKLKEILSPNGIVTPYQFGPN
jgi:hypothetical protein